MTVEAQYAMEMRREYKYQNKYTKMLKQFSLSGGTLVNAFKFSTVFQGLSKFNLMGKDIFIKGILRTKYIFSLFKYLSFKIFFYYYQK